MTAGGSIELVLFDLGGVLVQLKGMATMGELTGMASDELWGRWLACPWVRRFESGRCTPDEFATGLVAEWELPISREELLAEFRSWPTGPMDGAAALVADAGERTAVGCLSNSNRLHWDDVAGWDLMAHFDEGLRFLSFELGAVKPDRAIFDLVAQRLPVPPGRVLFLDDNAPNVEGARAAGFGARQVDGPAAARQALESAGVLPRS